MFRPFRSGICSVLRHAAWMLLGCRTFAATELLAQAHSASTSHPISQGAHAHYDFSPVEHLLRDSLKHFDGRCTLVLMQNGRTLYEKNLGGMTADSIIPIASGSKWLASALFLTFVDDGTLSLDDPASKYLRYLTGAKAKITLRELFSHTSGFAGEIPAMRDMKLTIKDAAYRISTEKLAYAPGTHFAYGGASMQLGGRIVEIVGKKPFEELFQERIAKPLNMTHTSFYGLGKTQNPLLAGGAKSSTREYMRFLQMLANKGVWNGRRILSEAAITAMYANHAGGVPVLRRLQSTSANLTLTSERANYGLGVWRTSPTATPSEECIEISCQGRFGFSPWMDMRRNVIGVLATYTPQAKMQATYKRMKQLLREIIPPAHTTASVTNPLHVSSIEQKR